MLRMLRSATVEINKHLVKQAIASYGQQRDERRAGRVDAERVSRLADNVERRPRHCARIDEQMAVDCCLQTRAIMR